jgi:hypothetical protein
MVWTQTPSHTVDAAADGWQASAMSTALLPLFSSLDGVLYNVAAKPW